MMKVITGKRGLEVFRDRQSVHGKEDEGCS
jgi:hypothetical protein